MAQWILEMIRKNAVRIENKFDKYNESKFDCN